VNANKNNDFLEFDNALKQVQKSSQFSQHEHGGDWLNIVTEYIQEVSQTDPVEDILSEFLQAQECHGQENSAILTPPHQPIENFETNPIEEFSNHVQYETYGDLDLTSLNDFVDAPVAQQQYFPTPPHSENASSPMSDSQSCRNSDFTYSPERSSTLSPERSSPIYNSDYEKFQEIGNYDDYPSVTDVGCRDRKDSSSSMTMKQYKDLQKEISLSFSKKDCCQLTRRTCKQIFQEHLQKLKVEDRKDICFKIAKMDLKNAYG
jgi:hypothetical protein